MSGIVSLPSALEDLLSTFRRNPLRELNDVIRQRGIGIYAAEHMFVEILAPRLM
jgi:hypothetical protein